MNQETVIPDTHCPYCNYGMDRTTAAYGEGKPNKGDVSVCLQCAKPSVFNKDLTIRKPTPIELAAIRLDPDVIKLQITIAGIVKDK